ncbi:hypothetical protein BDM02DRAFT_3036617 [Thelephora ganbajun]|uniref:Uncharacterized protein n=1 Tax=Thelephora ganbajun TaxID=370292 RepID=A0ACB6Z9U8_THEGA|nr:hypothetical protein BDM02DRAFT_3036617 [Thelephora ganbajun]
MARSNELLPHVPVIAWDLLKNRPVFHDSCWGLKWRARYRAAEMVQEFRDIGLIASYLFVVWSEWADLDETNCSTMMALIREEPCGIEVVGYRADPIQRLDYVLSQLDPGSSKKQQHEGFRTALLEVG